MPLQNVSVRVQINDSIAISNITQVFYNPGEINGCKVPGNTDVEFVYKFPKEKDSLITKMKVTIGDRIVEACVEGKEEAMQKYDDGVA